MHIRRRGATWRHDYEDIGVQMRLLIKIKLNGHDERTGLNNATTFRLVCCLVSSLRYSMEAVRM